MIEPRDYTTTDELLSDLAGLAWDDQRELFTHGGTQTIHIPSHDPDRRAICKNQPERGRPKLTSTFPEAWRDDMEWCPYCLTREYLNERLERVKTLVTEDMELAGGAVIRAGRDRGGTYHTRECGLWPLHVRPATREEVKMFPQCTRCQQIEDGTYSEVGDGETLAGVVDGGVGVETPPELVSNQVLAGHGGGDD